MERAGSKGSRIQGEKHRNLRTKTFGIRGALRARVASLRLRRVMGGFASLNQVIGYRLWVKRAGFKGPRIRGVKGKILKDQGAEDPRGQGFKGKRLGI